MKYEITEKTHPKTGKPIWVLTLEDKLKDFKAFQSEMKKNIPLFFKYYPNQNGIVFYENPAELLSNFLPNYSDVITVDGTDYVVKWKPVKEPVDSTFNSEKGNDIKKFVQDNYAKVLDNISDIIGDYVVEIGQPDLNVITVSNPQIVGKIDMYRGLVVHSYSPAYKKSVDKIADLIQLMYDKGQAEPVVKVDNSIPVVKNVSDFIYSVDGVKYDLENVQLDRLHPLMVTTPLSPQWNESLIEVIKEQNLQPITESKFDADKNVESELDKVKKFVKENKEINTQIQERIGSEYSVEFEYGNFAVILHSPNIVMSEIIGRIDLSNFTLHDTKIYSICLEVRNIIQSLYQKSISETENVEPEYEAITESLANSEGGSKFMTETPAPNYEAINEVLAESKGGSKEVKPVDIFANYSNQHELNQAIVSLLQSKPLDYEFTATEKAFIYKYEGSGGLEKFGAEGEGLLHEYYTPTELIEKLWGLAYQYGFSGGKVLEPSVGIGRVLDYVNFTNTTVTAYEISEISKRICEIMHPFAKVKLGSFSNHFYGSDRMANIYNDKFEKDYDLVIGNPPYGKVVDLRAVAESGRLKAGNMRFEHYFILRGLDTLKSGGLLIYVSTANLFLKGYEQVKERISERAELLDGFLLPSSTFKTTKVNTSIIVLRKK